MILPAWRLYILPNCEKHPADCDDWKDDVMKMLQGRIDAESPGSKLSPSAG